MSSASQRARSSARSRIRVAARQRMRARSAGAMRGHGPSSNAFRAARAARSTSASPAFASVPLGASDAGLVVVKVSPERAGTHSPSMRRFRSGSFIAPQHNWKRKGGGPGGRYPTGMIRYAAGEPPTAPEYIEFLGRSDLGAMYPRRDFEARIGRLLSNARIVVTARDDGGLLVGACFGITDFAYFLFLTDLGVARHRVRQGIGTRMVAMAHEAAGGERVHLITWANEKAMPFYESCGMRPFPGLVAKHALDREP